MHLNPNLDLFLSRLNKVRQNGPGRWNACCPAHDDRSPSLGIKETDDGKILLHCFAGCEVSTIAAAVGMSLADLFPAKTFEERSTREYFNAADVLLALRYETSIIAIAASDILSLSSDDIDRVQIAYERINEAVNLAGVAL